jgi:hypothetical protein
MTLSRLMRYPVYQEGLLDALFAQVPPQARDYLVISALIRAVAGQPPSSGETGTSCSLL